MEAESNWSHRKLCKTFPFFYRTDPLQLTIFSLPALHLASCHNNLLWRPLPLACRLKCLSLKRSLCNFEVATTTSIKDAFQCWKYEKCLVPTLDFTVKEGLKFDLVRAFILHSSVSCFEYCWKLNTVRYLFKI